MTHALAIDHHAQRESPLWNGERGLEGLNALGDAGPLLLRGHEILEPQPLPERHLDGVAAPQGWEPFEQRVPEKRGVHAELDRQPPPETATDLSHQLTHHFLGTAAVMDVAGSILYAQDLSRLRQVSEQRVVARVLRMMRVEATHRPAHLRPRTEPCAIEINRQTAQPQPFDLVEHQFSHHGAEGAHPGHREALEPVHHRAFCRQAPQPAASCEQRVAREIAKVFGATSSHQYQPNHNQHQPKRSIVAAYFEGRQDSTHAATQIDAPTIPPHQLQSCVRGQSLGAEDYRKIAFDDVAKRRYRKPHSGGLPFGRDLCGHTVSPPYRRPLFFPMIISSPFQIFSDWG